jgi:hypothetical protein
MRKIIFCLVGLLGGGVGETQQPESAPALSDQKSTPADQEDAGITDAKVMAELKKFKKEFPRLHADALKVWKQFRSAHGEPNYSYYFWGRNLILWLEKDDKIKIDSEAKVKKVFETLEKHQLISADATTVLTRFAWESVHRLEKMPPAEQIMPQYRPELKHIFEDHLNKVDPIQDEK